MLWGSRLLRDATWLLALLRATCAQPASLHDAPSPTSAAYYESQGKLPPFAPFGKDVNDRQTLADAAKAIAYKKEIVLVCGDGSAYASPTALNTVSQFYAMRIHHVLYVSDSARSCETLRGGLPSLACVWSSEINATKPANNGLCNKRFWDMRFYFYVVRKRMVVHLAIELGYNVLQTDTDVAWFASPYPIMKTTYAQAKLISQRDSPLVNAGVFYVQNAKPGDGVDFVLSELARRIELFMFHPEAVKRYVPWAVAPYYANSDEQTLMNDVLITSIWQKEYYASSTAYWEVRMGSSKHTVDFESTKEGQLKRESKAAVARAGVVHRSSSGAKLLLYPLRPLGKPEAEPAWFAQAPLGLLHTGVSGAAPKGKTVGVDIVAEARVAEAANRPPNYATHRQGGPIMTHMSGLRTGAWSRRAMLRGQGLWHARADVLMGRVAGWGAHPRHLVLDLSSSGGATPPAVAARTRKQLDTLVGNLFLLAALSDSLLVVPESECFATTPRGFAYDMGGLFDVIETVPRLMADGSTRRACAWIPPKNCWRSEFLTQVEWERRQGQSATPLASISAREVLDAPQVRAAIGNAAVTAAGSQPISELLMSRPLISGGGSNHSFIGWVNRINKAGALAMAATSAGKYRELNASLSQILPSVGHDKSEGHVKSHGGRHSHRQQSAQPPSLCMASLFWGATAMPEANAANFGGLKRGVAASAKRFAAASAKKAAALRRSFGR